MKTHFIHGWKFVVCLLIAFIQAKTEAYASHAMGADLTYSCLGGNQYRLRLAFYRDCSGVSAPNNVTIDVSSALCNQNLTVVLNPIAGTGQDVTPICPQQLTTCNGGTNPGVQEYIYEGNITLPQQCTDWVFSFTLCCRNSAINTIVNPGSQNIYVDAHINNVAAPCNNSPVFSNRPVPYVCVGQQYCFNHGAVDADGDSLTYTLIAPETGPNTSVTYIAPYSAQQPVPSSPPMTFNPQNGDICMTPSQIIVTVMAVRVDEWRNGINIGSVVRDIQLHTIMCSNALPYVDGINSSNNYSMTSCAGSPINFNINSFDPDAGQTVTMTWNAGIPGATFTTTGSPLPVGHFSWTPGANMISNTPYCFTITVTDDACPYFGTQTFAFCITITGFGINLASTTANCGASNGTASVTVNGGTGPFTYNWQPSGGNNANATGLNAGNYSVTVTDATGCTSTGTVTVGQGAAPGNILSSTVDVACYGGNNGSATVNVSGGQQPYTYSWSNGGTNATISNLTAGTYSITVTTANGCISTATVTVSQPATAVSSSASVTANVSCYGGNNGSASAAASGGTGPYVYNWNTTPPQNTATATTLTSGTFAVVVTDAHGCTSSSTVTVTQPPALVEQSASTPVTCYGGTNGTAITVVSGGTPPYNCTWNSTPPQSSTTATNLPAGSYTATITDAHGCISTSSVIVNQPTALSASILSSNNVSCYGGANGTATSSANGGTAPYNYSWNTIPAQYSQNASGMSSGNYTLTVTDAHGCATVSTVTITQPAQLAMTVSPGDTICPGNPAVIAASASGGTGNYTYNWTPNIGTNSTYSVYPTSNSTYTVHVVDANGCTSNSGTIFVDVYQFAFGDLTVTPNVSICNGATAGVGATITGNNTGPLTWNWSNNASWNGPGPFTVQPTSTTTYNVTVTNVCGVVVTNSVTVTVHPLPQLTLAPQAGTACDRVGTVFSDNDPNNTGCTYAWNFGDNSTGTGNNVTHNYTATGNYTVSVTITSPFGCTGTATTQANVVVFQSPVAAFNMSAPSVSILEPTVDFYNQSSSNTIAWQWDFGDNATATVPSPVHTYAAKGTYTARLVTTSTGGCTDTIAHDVIVEPEFTLYIPNAFTPNGDGKNDVFLAVGEEVTDFSMQIFDRWGELIYQTKDMNAGWNGSRDNNGTVSQEGVYVYSIVVTDFKGRQHHYLGHISLIP